MQTEAAEVVDLSPGNGRDPRRCTASTETQSRSFGTKCLMARRLVESGVRFVQVFSDGEWDAHSNLTKNHTEPLPATDVPIDGLLTDLKQRGLLDSTLVIWGGEFGRMPVSQGSDGRDHNPHGFSTWMAGAGIKGGVSYGETDEIGYKAAVDPRQRARPARHDAAPAGPGPQAADLLPQRPQLPPDRRGRQSDPADSGVSTVAFSLRERSAFRGAKGNKS